MSILAFSLLLATRQGPALDFSKAWTQVSSTISQSYYARNSRKQEMVDRLQKYGPIASKATSIDEFDEIVNKMIDEFHDSHFDFYAKSDQGYYLMGGLASGLNGPKMASVGAWFKKVDTGYAIQMLFDNDEAAKAGMRKGDVVTQVDGQPFTPVNSLMPLVGKNVSLTYLRAGQTLQATVSVKAQSLLSEFLADTKSSVKTISSGGHKYGYIHMWTLLGDEFKNALSDAAYSMAKSTDGFILDLRDGFGGRPEGFADPFFRPGVTFSNEMGGGKYEQPFGYGKPLIVITNEGSRSAKEVLSYILKKSKRATLVGSTTAGNVLGTFPQAISDWAYIEVPVADMWVDGIHLEHNGVVPDIRVPQEFDANGRDLFLEEAVRQLDKKSS